MVKWYSFLIGLISIQAFAQYSYTYTDPCTLQSKSVYVPAGGGVVVNYFDNHSTFSANDFATGAFDAWISLVSQQNSNSPCETVTTTLTNNVVSTVTSNTVSIVTNVVSISSLAQSIATIGSSMGSSISSTTSGTSSMGLGNAIDNNQSNSNGTTNNKQGRGTGNSQTDNQNEGSSSSNPGTGRNTNTTGKESTNQGRESTGTDQSTEGGKQETQPTVEEGSEGSSGNTANSVSNAVDGGGSSESGGSSKSSKKEKAAKAGVGSFIASGDMVLIASADDLKNDQYKIVGSITHSNTRGTRIKGALFNFTTGVNNLNITLYKSYINKSRLLNTIIANSTMMDFDKNIFNTTTGLESYKFTNNLTGMFGLNLTAGKMGERGFYNISSVAGGHVSKQLTQRTSTSFLALAIYSPFTQFYDGKWFGAGLLIVPFSSWDFKITKTFKYNVSFTGVYEMNKNFLNYQMLTGGKISF